MKNIFETKVTPQEMSKYIFFDVKAGVATITQLDSDGIFRDEVAIELEDSKFALDKLEFQKVIKVFKEPKITLSKDKTKLNFVEGKTKINLKAFYDKELQELFPILDKKELSRDFITKFNRAKLFAAINHKTLALNNVFVKNDKLLATDSFKAIEIKLDTPLEKEFMLPKEIFTIFKEATHYSYDGHNFILYGENGKMVRVSLIEGEYPKIDELINKHFDTSTKVEFDFKELSNSLSLISKLGGEKVSLNKDNISLKNDDKIQIEYNSDLKLELDETFVFSNAILSASLMNTEMYAFKNGLIFKNDQEKTLVLRLRS